MKKKRIILSYDYELFFGDRSGTVLKSIIEPTNMLMDVMEKNGLRGDFFIDYLMFRELEKQNERTAQADLKQLKDQVRDIVRRGHRIELHLHPHWVDAVYNGDGTWNFDDFTHYSLSSLDEDTIIDMFKSGTDYLTALARDVIPDYKIVAFRAGGWAVQPFNVIKHGLEEAGIIIDSSTSYGIYNTLEDSYYDFRIMPNKDKFHFADDVCTEKLEGQFVEIPITSFKNTLLFSIEEKIVWKFLRSRFQRYSDGTHARKGEKKKENKSFAVKLKEKLTNPQRGMMNFSYIGAVALRYLLLTQNIGKVICFIDHPKDVCDSTIEGINLIAKYCQSIHFKDMI